MSTAVVRRLRPWLGTYVAIEAHGEDEQRATAAVEAAYAEVAAIHEAMSFHSSNSDLARLHRHATARPVQVSRHTWNVLTLAMNMASASDGLFDPTIAPHLVHRGALPHPDAPAPDPTANWRDVVVLGDQQVRFQRPLWIDLGGIAKGYAVDCAVDVLLAHGVCHGVVNAGGDLRVFGGDASMGLPLAVRHPNDPSFHIAFGTLQERAAATSGDFFFGRLDGPDDLSPIVDPRAGLRAAVARSVTVIAERCAIADALTKVVSLLGRDAQALLARFGATAAIIEPPDQLHAAPDFWQVLGARCAPGDSFAFP